MSPTVHYVVAAYLGDRHFMDPRFASDRWYYLRCQVQMLRRLKHSLAKVTFVINTDVPLEVPAEIASAGEVIQRPNVGMSYGAYAHAFKTFGDQFSHYILNEDDYLFTQDDFDGLLLEEMASPIRRNCAILCGAAYEIGHHPVHPAVSCMLCTTEGLTVLAGASGGLLPHFHTSDPNHYRDAYQAQAAFGDALAAGGYSLEDWLLRWSTAYRIDGSPSLATRWFSRRGQLGNPHRIRADFDVPAMVVSAQALDIHHPISDGYEWHPGTIRSNGTAEF